MNDLKAKRIAILNKTKGNVPTGDEKKLRDIQDEDDRRTPDSKIPKQLRPHITKKREWKNKEAGFYTVMKTAGLVKEAAFGDSVRGALGMETDSDRARRAAMMGAAVPFAGPIGAALGGGLEGGAGGAAGGALGSMLGGGLGAGVAGLGAGTLGAALMGPRAARMMRAAMESEVLEQAARKARKAWEWSDEGRAAWSDAAQRSMRREGPGHDEFQKLLQQKGDEAIAGGIESVMSADELAALRSGANWGGYGSAAASLGFPAAALGGYAGNIYGAGQGAEWGTE